MIKRIPLLLTAFLFTACISQKDKILFIPDPSQNVQQEQPGLSKSWEILESQNGSGDEGFPAWVRSYYDEGAGKIETLDSWRDKYVFIGKNRGDNFQILRQWTDNFTVEQDLPRLIVQRVERRLVAAATLYPDDEYGEYFALMIKRVSDEEYPDAVKEDVFWTKQRRIPDENENADTEEPPEDVVIEHYEYLILISIDRMVFQTQIQNIMADIKTPTSPTRDQTAAINNIRLVFFEGF